MRGFAPLGTRTRWPKPGLWTCSRIVEAHAPAGGTKRASRLQLRYPVQHPQLGPQSRGHMHSTDWKSEQECPGMRGNACSLRTSKACIGGHLPAEPPLRNERVRENGVYLSSSFQLATRSGGIQGLLVRAAASVERRALSHTQMLHDDALFAIARFRRGAKAAACESGVLGAGLGGRAVGAKAVLA